MPARTAGRRDRGREAVASVAFHRTKYGAELLVDVAWIHDIPTFLLDRPHQLRFHDLTLVTRGRGHCWLDDRAYRVEPGVLLCTSPGQVRRWTVEDLDGICLFFPAEFLEAYFSDPLFLHRLPCFGAPAGARVPRLEPLRALLPPAGGMRAAGVPAEVATVC